MKDYANLAVLKIEANRYLSFLFTLRFCYLGLLKAKTFFTEDDFVYLVRGCLFTSLFYFNISYRSP